MVKYKSYTDVNRNMIEYKMRTAYVTPIPIKRVASNLDSACSTSRHVTPERSHSKLNTSKEFDQSKGHNDNNTPTRRPSQQDDPIQSINHHETVSTTTEKKSCCTIL